MPNKKKNLAKSKAGRSAPAKRVYKIVRREGISKKKAARIAAAVGTSMRPAPPEGAAWTAAAPPEGSAAAGSAATVGSPNGVAAPEYAQWSRADLLTYARTVDIKGRSAMNKAELVEALHRV